MLILNIKEICQEKIMDVIIVLLIIHLGTVVFSFLIKWIHPYLKNYVAMYHSENSTTESKNKSVKNGIESDSNSSDEDYINMIDNLKPLVEMSEIPQEVLDKVKSKSYLFKNISFGIKNALNLRNILVNKLEEKRCSSEAQTNITINPQIKIDYSCPKIILSHVSPGLPVQTTTSSDEFESASSGNSETTDIDNEYMPIFRNLGYCNMLKKKKPNDCSMNQKVQQYKGTCSMALPKRESTITYNGPLSKDFGKQVSEENKILEMAITEFERELKPIRDQIKLLKECINGFESCASVQQNLLNDSGSSFTGTLGISETSSDASCTTCSTALKRCISSSQMVAEKKYSGFKIEVKLNSVEKSGELSNTQNVPLSKDVKYVQEMNKPKKRSPLAEMYIKLSQTNSQSGDFVKTRKQNAVIQSEDGNTITCHINLNVNVGTVSLSNIPKRYQVKERALLPLLSAPEDILGKPSDSHISLSPAKQS